MSKQPYVYHDNMDAMAHDVGRMLFAAVVTVFAIIFCAGVACGCLISWGWSS